MNHDASSLLVGHGVILTFLLLPLMLPSSPLYAVSAILTEPLETDCSLVQCTQTPECPADSLLKSVDESEDFDVDYAELATSNPFLGVHIEALGPIQRSNVSPVLTTTASTSSPVPATMDPTTFLTNDEVPPELRKKRELSFSDEFGVEVPQEAYKHCCGEDLPQCVCKLCPEVPKCATGNVAVELSMGLGLPGNCCSSYKCVPKLECNENVAVKEEQQFYWRDTCTKCSCFGSEELCQNQCQNDEPHKLDEGEVVGHKSCFSEYLQKPMSEGALWFEDNDCSECSCLDGKSSCFANLCAAVECKHPVKVKGKCCPVCEQSTVQEIEEATTEETELKNMNTTMGTAATTNDTTEGTTITSAESSTVSSSVGTSTETSTDLQTTIATTEIKESSLPFTTAELNTSATTTNVAGSSTTSAANLAATRDFPSTSAATVSSTSSPASASSPTTEGSSSISYLPASNAETTAGTTNADSTSTVSLTSTSTEIPSTPMQILEILTRKNSKVTETSTSASHSTTSSAVSSSLPTSTTITTATSVFATETPISTNSMKIALTRSSAATTSPLIGDISSTSTSSPLSSTSGPSTSGATTQTVELSTTISSSTSAPAPLAEPQPTSYRQSEPALISRSLEEDYNMVSTQQQINDMFQEVDPFVIVALLLGAGLCISLCIVLGVSYYNKNKKKLYSSIPNSETSLSQTSTNTNLSV